MKEMPHVQFIYKKLMKIDSETKSNAKERKNHRTETPPKQQHKFYLLILHFKNKYIGRREF